MVAQTVPDIQVPAMARDLPVPKKSKRTRSRPIAPGHTRVVESPPDGRGLSMVERMKLIFHALRNRDLTGFSARVLGELERKANPSNLCVWPSVNYIAEMQGALPTTVHHSLRELQEKGYITIHARGECPCKKNKSRTHYRLAALSFPEEAYLDTYQTQEELAAKIAQGSNEGELTTVVVDPVSANSSNGCANSSNDFASVSTPYIEPRKEPIQEPVPSPSPSLPSPAETTETPTTKGASSQKVNRSKALIDLLRERDIDIATDMRPQDHKALKDSTAPIEVIADAYAAVFNGAWGGEFIQQNLSVQFIIGKLPGYKAHLKNPYAHKRVSNKGPEPGTLTNW